MSDEYVSVDPEAEADDAQPWLDMLEQSEKAMQDWQDAADNIDKAYASLEHLRGARDREFQLFWSNIQVMGPSIYARPPVPVVTPKFKDRRPLYRTASEMLERCCQISFDMGDIDQTMLALRDDLAIAGRGAAWVRYESDKDGERVCYEHLDRRDFRHDVARKWAEVDWVAKRAWLTKDEMRKRFGEEADEVQYETRRDEGKNGSVSRVEKCGVWEIWCKSKNRVVWVAEGCQTVLDSDEPHLKLEGFFPCPRPAYATLQRRSLIPVPDMLFYKDQLEEVGALTRRIHALSEAIKVRGFYAGSGDIGEAVERAISLVDDAQVLVPVPAMASLMQGGGEPIIWLPLEMIASTITGLIELRRQVIDDVYQIIGLSDIMRGATQAEETLGAQQLKQQNGSYRVRDKQNELVRVARDLVCIGADIMSNEFSRKTLESMAQMDLPTDADVKKQIDAIKSGSREELKALMEKAKTMADEQQIDPQQAQQAEAMFDRQQQQIIAKWQGELEKAQDTVTIDQVMAFLNDEKLRPFALDIETDSTIYPDEMAEKQSRQEFMSAFGATMATLQPMFMMGPEAISVAGGVFKFALAPYRVGRELEGLIDDFVDQGPAMAQRLQESAGDGGTEELAKAQQTLAEAEMTKAQAAMSKVEADTALKQAEGQRKMAEAQAKAQGDQGKMQLEMIKLQQAAADGNIKSQEAQARIDQMKAQTMKLLTEAGVMLSEQQLNEFNSLADIELRKNGQVMDATAQVADQSGEKPAPGAKATTGTTQNAVMEGLAMLGQMLAQQSAAIQAGNQAVIQAVMAPTVLNRGPDGRAVSAQKVVVN